MRILFLLRRVGPYHHARYQALGRRADLVVVETRSGSQEYPWQTANENPTYTCVALPAAGDAENGLRGSALREALAAALQTHRPDVVACTGWADPEYHRTLLLCASARIPVVVMSDSTRDDDTRRRVKEHLKRRLIAAYSAALVAGTRSRDYLRDLSFPADAVFEPWDVVDNAYFERGAAHARTDLAATRAALRLSRPYLLCVSRYLPKKNLSGLLEAYAAYRANASGESWDLVVLGSGELEAELRGEIARRDLGAVVHLPGFVQYDRLPAYYAAAEACILPSLSDQWGLAINEAMASGLPVLVSAACGCAPDLVVEGGNGFIFDPRDTTAMRDCLVKLANLPAEERRCMGEAGRRRIVRYSPEAFADGLLAAAEHARRAWRPMPLASRAVLSLLARR